MRFVAVFWARYAARMRAFTAPIVFTGNRLHEDAAVVVDDDGLITAVGDAAKVVPAGAHEIPCDGALLPGLIDAHTHVCLSASPDPGHDCVHDHPAHVAVRAAENLSRQLDAGVTTIRDVGGVHGIDLELMRLVERGVLEGPDMLAAGQVLCITGGHACFMGVECDSADDFRRAARQQIKDGARLVKVIATGGVITPGVRPGTQQMSTDELRAAVTVAHRASRRVAAHAQGTAGIEAALEAGVDTIEHGFWLSDVAIARMVADDRSLVPTFAALRSMQRDREDLPAFIQEKLDEVDAPQRDSFARARAAGVRLVTGTDAGTPGNPHGNIGLELRAFADLGVHAHDCWRAATVWAAEALGTPDRGRLEPGLRADLIAIPRAALDDVQLFDRPLLVAKRGKILRGTILRDPSTGGA